MHAWPLCCYAEQFIHCQNLQATPQPAFLLAHTVTRSTLQKKKMMVALMSFSDVFCWQLKYHIYTKGRQWSPNYTLALCALKYLERLRGKGEDRSLIHSNVSFFAAF